jgi:hypothetical protein
VKLKERAEKVTARMPLDPKKKWKVHYALFARRGFTPDLLAAAKAERTRLVTFDQIVEDLGQASRSPIR